VSAGKSSYCVIRYVQDGYLCVKKLAPGSKVGDTIQAKFQNQLYPATITFVGGKQIEN
jgi:hypothetical protein